jgi:hypothetical protein
LATVKDFEYYFILFYFKRKIKYSFTVEIMLSLIINEGTDFSYKIAKILSVVMISKIPTKIIRKMRARRSIVRHNPYMDIETCTPVKGE